MALDSLELQLSSAVQRFAALQRRVSGEPAPPKLLGRALAELDCALEEIRVAQEQLVENRARVEHLQEALRTQTDRYWQLFNEMPEAYLVTRDDSSILEVNKAASTLLNVSQRFLVGKTLSVFVCQDRARFLTETAAIAHACERRDFPFRLRPRERAPIDVVATVTGLSTELRWILRPSSTAV